VAISPTQDVKTVEDFVSAPRALLEQAQQTGRPIVIAEAGKPAVVLLSAERYEWLVHLLNFSRLVNEAEEDVRAGRTRPLEDFIRELENEGKLPRQRRRVSLSRSAGRP
jgi:prevent-host-death family protein